MKRCASVLLAFVLITALFTQSVYAEYTDSDRSRYTGFYVTGSEGLCGSDWNDGDDPECKLQLDSNGQFYKDFKNISAGTYQFKVFYQKKDGEKNYCNSGNAITVKIDKDCAIVRIVVLYDVDYSTQAAFQVYYPEEEEYSFDECRLIAALKPEKTKQVYTGKFDADKFFSNKKLGISKIEKTDYNDDYDRCFYTLTLNQKSCENVLAVCEALDEDDNIDFTSTIATDDFYTDDGNVFADNQLSVGIDSDDSGYDRGYVEKTLNELIPGIKKITDLAKGDYTQDYYIYQVTLNTHNCANVLKAQYILDSTAQFPNNTDRFDFCEYNWDELPEKEKEIGFSKIYVRFTEQASREIENGDLDPEQFLLEQNLGIKKTEIEQNEYDPDKYYHGSVILDRKDKENFRKVLYTLLDLPEIQSAALEGKQTADVEVKTPVEHIDVKDAVKDKQKTKTLRFYMPEEWRNSYNDCFDGSLKSCAAGIYWWAGTDNCLDYYGADDAWYGYKVTEKDEKDENIFVARIPSDVEAVIFNNAVVRDYDDPLSVKSAMQTTNLTATKYLPGEDRYGFYPDGTEDFDSMIFVCCQADIYEGIGQQNAKGAWFYYYGDGKYGYYKTLEEAEQNNAVYSGGAWPYKENTTDPRKAETDMTKPASYADVVSVDKAKKANPMKVTAKAKTVKAKKLKKSKVTVSAITVKNAKGKVTYKKLSGSKKLTLTKKGRIIVRKGTKKGAYNIKVRVLAKGTKTYAAKTVIKKIKIKVK